MLIDLDPRAGLKALTILGLAFASAAAMAEPVSLAEAQALAVARDAGGAAYVAEAAAARERAVAAGELPDPEARLGAVNLPADSFDFRREDMTMIEVGVMQRFPPGRSRGLARGQLEHHALHFDAEAAARAREVRAAVARLWRELDYLEATEALVVESRDRAMLMIEGEGAAYASGEGRQADLLAARLELLEVEQMLIERGRMRATAQAELERWTGALASARVPAPEPEHPAPLAVLRESLASHPMLQGLEHQANAADLDAALARERYKPSFGVDLGYGFRQGRDMAGEGRPGMLTAMLTFDLPLFTRDRQDRELAAARSMKRGAEARREDAARELEFTLQSAYARAESLRAARDLYRQEMMPVGGAAVEAALAGYRAGEGTLAEVLGAQRRLLEIRDRELRLSAEFAIVVAELESLTGELP
ncbi:MAG: TolC family protein [Steroidobacteraceae bacterium]|nr:TolC family protein [Steroidobacteraceae bacterium]